jgi:hypothetical protein
MAQVDLGLRRHRHRPLSELGPQALEVMQVAISRADAGLLADTATLVRPGSDAATLEVFEHPPLAEIRQQRRTTA